MSQDQGSPHALADIQEMDIAWLTKATGKNVSDFDSEEIIGAGYASRMYRLLVHLAGEPEPLRLILKLATVHEAQQELIVENQLFREVNFYRDYSGRLADSGILPTVYFAGTDPERMQITLLMEDMGDIPVKPFRENLENSLAAMSVLAQVHAAYWNTPELEDHALAPVDTQLSVADLEGLLAENLEVEAAAGYSFPYLRKSMLHLLKLVKWVISDADHFTGPVTLVHGDFHARNIHCDGDRPILFDWQVTERGRPARDVVYWILSSVDVDDAQAFAPLLIERYLSALGSHGVNYPKKEFDKDFREVCNQLIPRFFCFQTLVQFSEEDSHTTEDFLNRTNRLAIEVGLLNQLRVARVIVPPLMIVLRLLGLRKKPVAG